MRRFGLGAALALGALSAMSAAPADAAETNPLELRRVLLSTGGVGYFEHEATVTGDATLSLDVGLDQVSDVLKSIVVLDEKGRVGQATVPGREPLTEAFRDLPFSLTDLSSPASLLAALRGSSVRVSAHGDTFEGRIVSVVEENVSLGDNHGTVLRHRLTLMGALGLKQVLIEEADGIEIVDATLKAQVEKALTAIAENGAKERREITITVRGDGERKVRVGYVIGAPLWKATYRLVLPNQTSTARMEGWALLENMSGKDWRGVDLTVASGNPVTLRQAIYEAYFVNRPEVPVEIFGRVLPPLDVGAVGAPAPAAADHTARFFRGPAMGGGMMGMNMSEAEAPAAPVSLPTASENETQVSFHFPDPIDVPRGESLLVPITSRDIPIERVSMYRASVEPLHPLASIKLDNKTGTSLPPGLVSMYDEASGGGGLEFVGDARLPPLPAGESRMLSYAVDLAVRVDRDEKVAQVVTGATIARGVLNVVRVERRTTEYKIAGAPDEDRVVILEHPRLAGFDLKAPTAGLMGDTPEYHRIRVEVPKGKTVAVDVVLERPINQTFMIATMGGQELDVLMSGAEISDAVRGALTHVAELRRTLATREDALAALEAERAREAADQERIRKNLAAAPVGGDLRTRYLAALAAAEDRIGNLDRSLETARAAVKQAKDELANFIASLTL